MSPSIIQVGNNRVTIDGTAAFVTHMQKIVIQALQEAPIGGPGASPGPRRRGRPKKAAAKKAGRKKAGRKKAAAKAKPRAARGKKRGRVPGRGGALPRCASGVGYGGPVAGPAVPHLPPPPRPSSGPQGVVGHGLPPGLGPSSMASARADASVGVASGSHRGGHCPRRGEGLAPDAFSSADPPVGSPR